MILGSTEPFVLAKVYSETESCGNLSCRTTYVCMVTSACKESAYIECEVKSVAEAEVLEETGTCCKFVVDELRCTGTIIDSEQSCMYVRNYAPESFVLISENCICEVPHDVSVNVRKAELLLIAILFCIEFASKNARFT